jgi:hypothetical protein
MSYGSEFNASARTPALVANGQDAQRNASRWMRAWGFWDALATSPGTDRGIDIRASGAIGQVMFQAAGVDREALHELVGATAESSGDQLFFFTGTYYSREAIAYADQHRIALFTYDLDGSMTPQNSIARLVIHPPEVTGNPSPEGTTEGDHRSRPHRGRSAVLWDWVRALCLATTIVTLVWAVASQSSRDVALIICLIATMAFILLPGGPVLSPQPDP